MKSLGWRLSAFAAVALVALLPIGDPDLWWHLSAGRFIFQHAALPRADWLSYTMAGKAWADFEWLGEIVFYAAYRLGGLAALWALKAALFSMAAALVWLLLGRMGFDGSRRCAGLAAWAVCLIPRSDIRVELFSNAAFAALLIAVEWIRSVQFGRAEDARARKALIAFAAFFALWANLHAGFAAGLLLLCVHAAVSALDSARACDEAASIEARGRAAFFASAALAGLAGTLLNPYGPGVHVALLRHAAESPVISRLIQEWGSLRFGRAVHWPAILLLLAAGAAFIKDLRAGKAAAAPAPGLSGAGTMREEHPRPLPSASEGRASGELPAHGGIRIGPWLAAGVFGLLCVRHARLIPYFATAAVPLALRLLDEAERERTRRLSAALVLVCAAFAAYRGFGGGLFQRAWDDRYAPRAAAAFLEDHPELLGRRMYHAWGWGGYLGFMFSPRLRVFQDGRYIFHPLFAEAASAAKEPDSWGEFLSKYGRETAVVENLPAKVRI
ncbi:MAG: hypothetical protein WCI75_10070, partial [candidate division NC10 bacterium]